jgi:hypothetical protein
MDRFKTLSESDPRFEEFYKSIQEDIGIIFIASRKVHVNDTIIADIIEQCIAKAWNRYKRGGSTVRVREQLYTRVVHGLIGRFITEMISAKENGDK